MGRQIIKQPNGKYCIFSSVVDSVIIYNATAEEIVEAFIADSAQSVKESVTNIITQLDAGGKPYYQFTKSFDEMISTIKVIHGKAKSDEVRNLILTST